MKSASGLTDALLIFKVSVPSPPNKLTAEPKLAVAKLKVSSPASPLITLVATIGLVLMMSLPSPP